MKNILLFTSVLGLIFVVGCESSLENIPNQVESSSNEFMMKIFVKGKVAFDDGTVYESNVEKSFDLANKYYMTGKNESENKNNSENTISYAGCPGYQYGWGHYLHIDPNTQVKFVFYNANYYCHTIWFTAPQIVVISYSTASFFIQSYWKDYMISQYSPGNNYSQGTTGSILGSWSDYVYHDFGSDDYDIDELGLIIKNTSSSDTLVVSTESILMSGCGTCSY